MKKINSDDKQPKAPYIPKGWLDKFLDLSRRVMLHKIDRHVVRQYDLAPPKNESKLVSALRFLKIINTDGTVNEESYSRIRMEGDAFRKHFQEIVSNSYSGLTSTHDLSISLVSDIKNYFIGTYKYSAYQAMAATIMLAYLCEKAGIPISEELTNLNKNKIRSRTEGVKGTRKKKKSEDVKEDFEPIISLTQNASSDNTSIQEKIIILRMKGGPTDTSFKIANESELDYFVQQLQALSKLLWS